MNRMTAASIVALMAVSFVLGRAWAQEARKAPTWRQQAQPHADLAKSAGDFDVQYEFFVAPGQPPMKGLAASKREMILNGNYLQETFKMNMMGAAFEGRLTLGYDTVREKMVSTWIDSSSPCLEISYGEMKDNKMSFSGEGVDDATGTVVKKRMVLENLTADAWTAIFFQAGADGKETMTMRLTYKRKKKE